MKLKRASILIEHFELCCSEAQKGCKQDVFLLVVVNKMLFACWLLVVNKMLFACCLLVNKMLFTCCLLVVNKMLFTCCLLVVANKMLCACCLLVVVFYCTIRCMEGWNQLMYYGVVSKLSGAEYTAIDDTLVETVISSTAWEHDQPCSQVFYHPVFVHLQVKLDGRKGW